MPRRFSSGNTLHFEAAELPVERVQRHLHGIERKSGGEHPPMNFGVLMACKSYKPDFAFLLGLRQRFRRAIRPDEQLRIVIEAYAVYLPQIQMVRLQTAQRFLQHAQAERLIAPVRADLGHQEHALANALQPAPHPFFALAAVVFPTIVEGCDAAVYRFAHQAHRSRLIFGIPQVVSAIAQCRHLHVMAAEPPHRYSCHTRKRFADHRPVRAFRQSGSMVPSSPSTAALPPRSTPARCSRAGYRAARRRKLR